MSRGLLPAGPCAVLVVGVPGSGKSTLAARLAASPSEIVSSDETRRQCCDSPAYVDDPAFNRGMFDLMEARLRLRLGRGLFSVVDATMLLPWHRWRFLACAQAFGAPAFAAFADARPGVAARRNLARPPESRVDPAGWRRMLAESKGAWDAIKGEGYQAAWRLDERQEVLEAWTPSAR